MLTFTLPGWKMTYYEESRLVGGNGHVIKLERKWMEIKDVDLLRNMVIKNTDSFLICDLTLRQMSMRILPYFRIT